MSDQIRQWQAQAEQQGLSLANYLLETLDKAPEQLQTLATRLGLKAIEPPDRQPLALRPPATAPGADPSGAGGGLAR